MGWFLGWLAVGRRHTHTQTPPVNELLRHAVLRVIIMYCLDMVYCCAACGKLYSCKRSLTTHMKEKHGNRKEIQAINTLSILENFITFLKLIFLNFFSFDLKLNSL